MAQPSRIEGVDIAARRTDFPALAESVHGRPLAYLDTAASAQKPYAVIERMREAMSLHYANVHRGLYRSSQLMTQAYEDARAKVAQFINAKSPNEIVFTRNATEGINLVAQSLSRLIGLKPGDEIVLTELEHHANIVPWQMVAETYGAVIKVVPVLHSGALDLDAYRALLSERTRVVSFVHVSNSFGTVNPAAEMVGLAKAFNPDIKVLVDASQSVVHGSVDVAALGCDFLVFTGHKLYGPTGIGVLWGREGLLNAMPPYQGGGDMIERVSFGGTTFKPAPARFEAGTPAIVEAIGLGAAVDYVAAFGHGAIAAHEAALAKILDKALAAIDGVTVYGAGAPERVGIASFTCDFADISDVAMLLDRQGVAVRAGHHCCMPLMARLGVAGTLRASIGLYTNEADIDVLAQGLRKAKEMLT